jgi:Tol biopolymer transport system component
LHDTHSGWERPLVTPKDFPDRSFSLTDLTFSPDGQRLAYTRLADKSEAIWVSTLNGESPAQVAHETANTFQRGPTWSPDGNSLAYYTIRSGHYALMTAPADGSGAPRLVRMDAGTHPAWSPKGDVIATLTSTGVLLVNADASGARAVADGVWLALAWSKHGDVLYGLRRSGHQRFEFASIDPRSGAEVLRADLGPWPGAFSLSSTLDLDPIRGASISPDGKTLLTSVLDGNSELWLLTGFKK